MSGPDSSGRIASSRPSAPQLNDIPPRSSSSPNRALLSSNQRSLPPKPASSSPDYVPTSNNFTYLDLLTARSPRSPPHQASPSSSRSASPSHLPYLRTDEARAGPSRLIAPQGLGALPSAAPPLSAGPGPLGRVPKHRQREGSLEATSPLPKRRPSPLDLGKNNSIGLDEELELQMEQQGVRSGVILTSEIDPLALSEGMRDLSLLRETARENLVVRPVDSHLTGSGSDRGTSGFPTPNMAPLDPLPEHDLVPISTVLDLLRSSSRSLIVDVRPVGAFLEAHLPRSANLSIPTLIFKRLQKASMANQPTWDGLATFVSTTAGKEVWDSLDRESEVDVVIVGTGPGDGTARMFKGILEGMVTQGSVRVLEGGWLAVNTSEEARRELLSGELSQGPCVSSSSEPVSLLPPPKTDPNVDLCPPPLPPHSPPRTLSHQASMPSLRPYPPPRRNLPNLTLETGNGPSSRRPPKLSLHLDKAPRSAIVGSFGTSSKTPGLSLSVPDSRSTAGGRLSTAPAPFSSSSFQALCHAQSKLPPSPSSFGDVRAIGTRVDIESYQSAHTPGSQGATARPGRPQGAHPASATGDIPRTAGLPTSRHALMPFIISTILPNFLFLGPEITSQDEVDQLKELGIRRVLNVAIECNDDQNLGLRAKFEKYHQIPMKDNVEESGAAAGMRESCDFLDDARLHSAPTYVHCKAGKSRSVTVVLAYLIHANAWTLKTAYAYVAERRQGISPNIGFVAELMQFEESELGLKQSGGVHGEGTGRKAEAGQREERKGTRHNPRHMRESLPPKWSSSLDSQPAEPSLVGNSEDRKEDERGKVDEAKRPLGDDREVRKNGQWVHQRRTPVDRTTLQPGRRVSKAGLESLRSLGPTDTAVAAAAPSVPSPGFPEVTKEASTPGRDGRLDWV